MNNTTSNSVANLTMLQHREKAEQAEAERTRRAKVIHAAGE